MGSMGLQDLEKKTKFYNTIGTESGAVKRNNTILLEQCRTRIENVNECVVGSEYAKIYQLVSSSTRNLQAGGLGAQPILPLPAEFLSTYAISDIELLQNISGKQLERYMDDLAYDKRNLVIVGSYIISSSPKKAKGYPFSLFTNVGYIGVKGIYNITSKNTLSFKKSNDGLPVVHLLPSSIGLKATRGYYDVGVVVALRNDLHPEPQCLFYRVPQKVFVKPVYQDIVVGIYVYLGIPLFLIGFILVGAYSIFCPFSDVKNLSQMKYEEQEKEEAKNIINQEEAEARITNVFGKSVSTLQANDILGGDGDESPAEVTQAEEKQAKKLDVIVERNKFSFSYLWNLNSDKIITQTGLRGYYYWKFYRRLVLIIGLYTILAFAVILPVNIVFNLRIQRVIDFAVTTFGSIPRNSYATIAHYVVSVAFFFIAVVVYGFSVRLTYFKRRYEASIFTCRLRHLPILNIEIESDKTGRCYIANPDAIETRENLLKHHFNMLLKKELSKDVQSDKTDTLIDNSTESSVVVEEDPVLSVNLIADMKHVMDDIDAQYRLEALLTDAQNKNITFLTKNRLRKLRKCRKDMIEKIKKKPLISTQCFITFRSVKALRLCKELYKTHQKKMQTSTPFSDQISLLSTWKIRQVTWEPEDVEWSNIYDSTRRNVLNTILVYIVYAMFFSVFIGILLIYFLRYGLYGVNSGLHFRQAFLTLNSSFLRRLVPLGLGFTGSIFSVFLTIAGEIANIIIRAVTALERMKSKSKASASYLLKSIVVIIPFYLTVPFIGDYQVEYLDTESFYNNISLNLMQFVLSYAFFYKGLEVLICVVKVTISYVRTRGSPERPVFDFNVAYTSALTIFFIIAVTGQRIPLLFIPGLLFFVVSYLVDTFLLLFLYERAVGTGRIEFGLVSALMLAFSAVAMLSHPSLSLILLGGSVVFLSLAFGAVAGLVFIYNRRGKKRSRTVHVSEESRFANKYAQPHLEMLLRRNDDLELTTELPDDFDSDDSLAEGDFDEDDKGGSSGDLLHKSQENVT